MRERAVRLRQEHRAQGPGGRGYYCVDNLPATLLLEVADFLALEAHHERIAVSVDARSASLPALPENIERLKARGFDCRVIYLEANTPTLLRRFSNAPPPSGFRRHDALRGDRARALLLAGRAARPAHRYERAAAARAAELIRDLLGLGAGALTLLFESFSLQAGRAARRRLGARRAHDRQSALRPEAAPLTGRDAPVIEYLEPMRSPSNGSPTWRAARALAAGDRAREPQPRDGGDRLHRRAPSLRLPRRAPRRDFPRRMECSCATAAFRKRRTPHRGPAALFRCSPCSSPAGACRCASSRAATWIWRRPASRTARRSAYA